MNEAIETVPAGSIIILDKVHKWALENNTWNRYGLESERLIVRDPYGVALVLPRLFPDRSLYEVSGHPPASVRRLETWEREMRVIPAT